MDDDPAVLLMVGKILRRGGYVVVAMSRPQEAVEWWRDHAAEAHAVVSDVIMPGMTGLELIEELRKHRPDMPALLISGYPDRVPRGVVGDLAPLLQKPFTSAQLLDAMRGLLGD